MTWAYDENNRQVHPCIYVFAYPVRNDARRSDSTHRIQHIIARESKRLLTVASLPGRRRLTKRRKRLEESGSVCRNHRVRKN